MKKIFTISIFLMVFSVLIIGQVVFDYFDTSANQNTKEQEEKSFYSSKFKSLEIKPVEVFQQEKFLKDNLPINFERLKDKVVIINFWASWCKPCLEELPSLVKLQNKIDSDQLEILAINTDEEKQIQAVEKTFRKFRINFKIVLDTQSKFTEIFDISAIPVTLIFVKSHLFMVKRGQFDFFSEEMIDLVKQNIK